MPLPEAFLQRLHKIVPTEYYGKIEEWFSPKKFIHCRINTIKKDIVSIRNDLTNAGIPFQSAVWLESALTFDSSFKERAVLQEKIKKGELYRQSLSSMLAVVALDPQPGEHILDMCAAPGSKTTQIAAHMKDRGSIVAIDAIKNRFYKLKSVIALTGATTINVKLMDARKYRPADQRFDRILVDAPCSSEGRFDVTEPKTYAYWSPRKIKEMVRKQRGLLLSATRLLKPGGILVYSTCTFSPEENEGVVNWLLRKTEGDIQLDRIVIPGVASYPAVMQWNGRQYGDEVAACLRVLPTENMEGFFIARFIRK